MHVFFSQRWFLEKLSLRTFFIFYIIRHASYNLNTNSTFTKQIFGSTKAAGIKQKIVKRYCFPEAFLRPLNFSAVVAQT
jgi:hypothetical protein